MNPGDQLGPYEIKEPLGAGGMGEVYLAEDTRLGRKVAIKVLPEEFAADPERLARFEREARAAAALNHPHIAVVHDIGFEPGAADGSGHPGTHYIVQEYLDGESLRVPLMKGALPLKKALALAGEVAEALAAAHSAGIVHRDLKPDNVFITQDGHAKVLDFGLAKLTELAGASESQLSMSPTMLGTVAGQVMGTAGYMAPEQAAGSTDIDHRADVFSFGCLVYESVTGRQPFAGRSVAETLSQIQHDDPAPLADLDPSLPAELQRIVKKCVAKEPAQRYQAATDLRVDLRSLAADVESGRAQPVDSGAPASAAGNRGVALAGVVGVAAGFALAAALVWDSTGTDASAGRVSRLSIPFPDELTTTYIFNHYINSMVAISPDGTTVAFVAGPSTEYMLHLRALDGREPRVVPGTEQAHNPFFSPDGQTVGFFTESGELKTVAIAPGSEPITLVRDFGNAEWSFGSWRSDGTIVFSTFDSGLFTVSAADGGTPTQLTAPADEAHQTPQSLPGSRAVLFYAQRSQSTEIQVLSLDDPDASPRTLVQDATHPFYLESGHLLYVQDGTLLARPFSVDSLDFTGPAFSVPLDVAFDNLGANDATPQLAVSSNGTLVYAPVTSDYGKQTDLVWVDREGTAEHIDTLDIWRPNFQLSPDNERLALEYRVGSDVLISTYDMRRNVLESTLTEKRQVMGGGPIWTPDGTEIVFSHPGISNSSMASIRVDGSTPERELFTQAAAWLYPFSFSQDGKRLAYSYYRHDTSGDIGVYELDDAGSGRIIEYLATSNNEDTARISPNGRTIAYVDNSGARGEIFVRPFPTGEGRRVTTAGGAAPLWSPDGSELFFHRNFIVDREAASGRGTELWVVAIETQPELEVGEARMLFTGRLYGSGGDSGYRYDISRDGQRFLMTPMNMADLEVTELVVVQNWFVELLARESAGQ